MNQLCAPSIVPDTSPAQERFYIFGKWEKFPNGLTAGHINEILSLAEKKRDAMANYPMDKILRLLDRLREKWSDPNYRLRKDISGRLVEQTGFSPEMVELGFEELSWSLNSEILEQKIKTETNGLEPGGIGLYNAQTRTWLRWHPLGVVLHVLAGNVFVGAAGSVILGLISRNINIFKMSSAETAFLPALIDSIVEMDNDGVISSSLAAISFASERHDIMSELKKSVDGIAVWGGEAAVQGWRNDLPARTRLIVFGPKLSLAVISKSAIEKNSIDSIAQKLAQDISIWDQNACTAPQACYVEGRENAELLADALATALKDEARRLPAGRLDMNTAIEIRKLRSIHEIAEAKGEGILRASLENLDWTVIVQENPAIEPSPLHRTIRIIPFGGIDEVLNQIKFLRGYIQTTGLACSNQERLSLSRAFADAGALRFMEIGRMAFGEIDDPHDGAYDLPQFMNLAVTRTAADDEDIHPLDGITSDERRALINQRLRRLIDKAKRSEFYGRRLKNIDIETVDDLARLAPLNRQDMETNMPPQGRGLATAKDYLGGYVSRSGGSTGEPKFSLYDRRDWEEMISNAVRIFRSMGLEATDRLANCMMAGDLYGSFVSFDHINHRLGLTTFAFANKVDSETLLDMWRKFKINAIEGIPTTLTVLLRKAKKLEPSFTLEKVIYGGSLLTPTDRLWFENDLGVKRVASVIGANDGGQIAYQCSRMKGAFHHTIDDFNYIEIVDEENRRVPDGTEGRILITSLLKFAFPLIRYDLEDIGRIVPGTCPCGRTGRMLEYLGRTGDILCIGLMNVRHRDFANALKDFPISSLQIAAQNKQGKEFLVVRAETGKPADKMKKEIHRTLLEKVAKLKERLDEGNLKELRIELGPPGSLPRNPRSGKIKNVVDERH